MLPTQVAIASDRREGSQALATLDTLDTLDALQSVGPA
jgi:hypothetical protein